MACNARRAIGRSLYQRRIDGALWDHCTGLKVTKAQENAFIRCTSFCTATATGWDEIQNSGDGGMSLANICRKSYEKHGYAHVPNFISSEIVSRLVREANMLADPIPFYSSDSHTIYQEDPDPAFSEAHPRNVMQQSSKIIVDCERIPSQSYIHEIYKSVLFIDFVGFVVGGTIYKSGCNYNAAYYNIFRDGDGLGWHFDRSDFGINLELQTAESGGHFELCQSSRSYDKVQEVLQHSATGDTKNFRVNNPCNVTPGSLVIFSGSDNLHRVTKVAGPRHRINTIMTYERKPNQKPNAYSLKTFFGR